MKIIDITEKLNFEEKPQIKIQDTVITVNNEAATVLKILPKLENMKPEDINALGEFLFEKSEQKKLAALHLSFADYVTVIRHAVALIAGNSDVGETQTRTLI